jgi:chromosome segregation ATPase
MSGASTLVDRIEQLAGQFLEIDERCDKQKQAVELARRTLNSDMDCPPSVYTTRHANLSQAEFKYEALSRERDKVRGELDHLRSIEAKRIARQLAHVAYQQKQNEFDVAQRTLQNQRAAYSELMKTLPAAEHRLMVLMAELAAVKSQVEHIEQQRLPLR